MVFYESYLLLSKNITKDEIVALVDHIAKLASSHHGFVMRTQDLGLRYTSHRCVTQGKTIIRLQGSEAKGRALLVREVLLRRHRSAPKGRARPTQALQLTRTHPQTHDSTHVVSHKPHHEPVQPPLPGPLREAGMTNTSAPQKCRASSVT